MVGKDTALGWTAMSRIQKPVFFFSAVSKTESRVYPDTTAVKGEI